MKKTTKPCNSSHTITTARRTDNIPLICTSAGPIYPVHSQPMSLATRPCPKRGYISAIFPPLFTGACGTLVTPPRGRGVAHARCARRRHALRTRVSAPQARAHCPLACSASSCSAISVTAMQPSSAAHWRIGCSESRVRARTLRTPVHTACSTVAIVLPFTALLPPASSAAAPRVAKTKTPRCSETSWRTRD